MHNHSLENQNLKQEFTKYGKKFKRRTSFYKKKIKMY